MFRAIGLGKLSCPAGDEAPPLKKNALIKKFFGFGLYPSSLHVSLWCFKSNSLKVQNMRLGISSLKKLFQNKQMTGNAEQRKDSLMDLIGASKTSPLAFQQFD